MNAFDVLWEFLERDDVRYGDLLDELAEDAAHSPA